MHFVRRATFRIASSSPSTTLIPKARSITTSSPFILRSKVQNSISTSIFRRFASEEVDARNQENSATYTEATSSVVDETESVNSAIDSVSEVAESLTNSSATGDSARGRILRPDRALTPTNGVYVGNLLFDITANDLTNEFQQFGTIKNAVVASDDRGLSKGFGYVEFETVEQATAAIEARNQTILEGRRLIVNYMARVMRESKSNPPSRTLFIGNLAFEMSDADLNKLFRDIRNVVDVRVAIDRRTGQPRGFAHADFMDIDSAQKALQELSGKEVYGRKLRIDFSTTSKSLR